MSSLQQYLDLYRANRQLVDEHSCPQLNARREEALSYLTTQQLPSRKEERYKHTDAEAAFAPDYGINLKRFAFAPHPGEIRGCSVPRLSTIPVHVINDVVVSPNKDLPLPDGVTLLTLCEAARQRPEWIDKYYDRAAAHEPPNEHKHPDRIERDVVTRLNTLLTQDGLLLHVTKGVKMEQTVQIVFRSRADLDMMSNRRLIIVAEEGAAANVLMCEHADGKNQFLTTQVTEVYLGEGAEVSLYTLEETRDGNTRFSNLYVEQQARSRFSFNGVTLTCGASRTMINVRMLGEGANCQTAVVAITDGKQQVDNSSLIDHVASACTSDMLYKYVLDGTSHAAFSGKVLVRPDAQKTLSQQNSANLVISPAAHVHSLPMLEIYADDVRCNHGSTIGKLDEIALLYLRQRGIPLAEARLLLQHAFVTDVLQRIPIEALRERLAYLVELRFRGELRHCQDTQRDPQNTDC